MDFVRECDGEVTAYEIKSGMTGSVSGLAQFKKLYPRALIEVIDWSRGEQLLLSEGE